MLSYVTRIRHSGRIIRITGVDTTWVRVQYMDGTGCFRPDMAVEISSFPLKKKKYEVFIYTNNLNPISTFKNQTSMAFGSFIFFPIN